MEEGSAAPTERCGGADMALLLVGPMLMEADWRFSGLELAIGIARAPWTETTALENVSSATKGQPAPRPSQILAGSGDVMGRQRKRQRNLVGVQEAIKAVHREWRKANGKYKQRIPRITVRDSRIYFGSFFLNALNLHCESVLGDYLSTFCDRDVVFIAPTGKKCTGIEQVVSILIASMHDGPPDSVGTILNHSFTIDGGKKEMGKQGRGKKLVNNGFSRIRMLNRVTGHMIVASDSLREYAAVLTREADERLAPSGGCEAAAQTFVTQTFNTPYRDERKVAAAALDSRISGSVVASNAIGACGAVDDTRPGGVDSGPTQRSPGTSDTSFPVNDTDATQISPVINNNGDDNCSGNNINHDESIANANTKLNPCGNGYSNGKRSCDDGKKEAPLHALPNEALIELWVDSAFGKEENRRRDHLAAADCAPDADRIISGAGGGAGSDMCLTDTNIIAVEGSMLGGRADQPITALFPQTALPLVPPLPSSGPSAGPPSGVLHSAAGELQWEPVRLPIPASARIQLKKRPSIISHLDDDLRSRTDLGDSGAVPRNDPSLCFSAAVQTQQAADTADIRPDVGSREGDANDVLSSVRSFDSDSTTHFDSSANHIHPLCDGARSSATCFRSPVYATKEINFLGCILLEMNKDHRITLIHFAPPNQLVIDGENFAAER